MVVAEFVTITCNVLRDSPLSVKAADQISNKIVCAVWRAQNVVY